MKKVQGTTGTKYRRVLVSALLVCLTVAAIYYMYYIDRSVPDQIFLIKGEEERLDYNLPLQGELESAVDAISINGSKIAEGGDITFAMSEPINVKSSATGTYKAKLKLFGLFHYKNVQFEVIEDTKVMPSGKAVGLYVNSNGVMVLGTSRVEGKDGMEYAPAENVLMSGDYIYEVDGREVENIDDVADALQEAGSEKITLKIHRGKNNIRVRISTVLASDGQYKIGAWLREDTEGIGTITYVTENNQYAALGHGITDVDTGELIKIQGGGVYPAFIRQVIPGVSGSPGEIVGVVSLGDSLKLGSIDRNTNYGISGNILQSGESLQYDLSKAVSIGLKQNVTTGKARIMCQLEDTVNTYDVEIEKIQLNSPDNKGMVIKVTDEKLLEKAGGIVQGMSGSPILQNGKIVGAVTHVFVDDSTRGYGIFLEDMLES